MSKPAITATTHTLPLDRLSPRDFERLCLWLVEEEGYDRAEHLGAAGSEQGRDLIAWLDGKLWAFQCKRVQSLGPADTKREVKKVADLPKDERPVGLIFLVTRDMSARARKEARNDCAKAGMACEFWTGTELDRKVKRHPDIVGEFFEPLSKDRDKELRDYVAKAAAAYEARMYGLLVRPPIASIQPYKFLYAFDVEDEGIFFGRDAATEALYQTVLKDRLTVLHARSGAGKTSLLNAGLSPLLIRKGYLPVYARAYDDPVRAIKQVIAPPSLGPKPYLLPQLTLHEFLGLICKELGRQTQRLVLILDQFEEFFIFWPERDRRQRLIEDLGDCYFDKTLPIQLVIGIRKDYYSDLADFEERIPTVFHNQYRLSSMTRGEAEAAISGPVSKLDRAVTYEPLLLDTLLDNLMADGLELPHLQIVCTHLYERLAAGETTITLEAYEALGRAQGVLGGYLRDELDQLPGHGASIAKEVFKQLVSSKATKRVLSYDVLAARVEAPENELLDVLARLVNARLLRRDEVDGEVVYEMAHEYLVVEIMGWMVREDLEFKQAEELLEREVENWRVHGTLIPQDRLEMLYQHRERLIRGLDGDARECILRSVLQAESLVRKWGQLADVESLIAILGDEDSRMRERAARLLGQIGDPVASEPLVAATGDEDWRVRMRAAEALARIGGPVAVEPLIAAMGDEKRIVRLFTAVALGSSGDPAAVEPLITALGDEDGSVRRWVASALGETGDPRVVEPLIAALEDGEWRVRSQAARALGRIGDAQVVERLIVVLEDMHRHVRSCAAEALGKIGDPRAVEPLIAVLGDEDSHGPSAVARALGEIGEPAVEPLITALGDEDNNVRQWAAWALGEIGDARAVEPLIAALVDVLGDVSMKAARALGEIGEPAVKSLITALRDEDGSLRQWVASALWKIGEPAVEPLIAVLGDEDGNVRQWAASALGGIGDLRAVLPLIAALGDEESGVCARVAVALGRIGEPAVEPLITALGDEDNNVRQWAAWALGEIGDGQAIPALINVLGDEDSDCRRRAAWALGEIGDARAVEPLITALGDEDGSLRQWVASALGEIGDARAVEPFITALGDESSDVRSYAAKALRAIGTPQAQAALEKAGR